MDELKRFAIGLLILACVFFFAAISQAKTYKANSETGTDLTLDPSVTPAKTAKGLSDKIKNVVVGGDEIEITGDVAWVADDNESIAGTLHAVEAGSGSAIVTIDVDGSRYTGTRKGGVIKARKIQ